MLTPLVTTYKIYYTCVDLRRNQPIRRTNEENPKRENRRKIKDDLAVGLPKL